MATPKRQLVLDNLFEALQAIAATAGARSVPKTVERTIKEWASTGAEERPYIGMQPAREIHTHQPFFVVDVKLTVNIVGHVTSNNDTERSQNLNDLMDAIYAAIHLDTTRGNNAISTTVLQTETEEGNPDVIDSRGGGGGLVMVVEIHYQRTTGAS